jgi:IS5 family transposase
VADVLYALVLRSYCNFPSRRFSHLLRLLLAEAQASGVITKVPGASSIQAYLGVPWMRSLLTELIASTSAPLRSAETVMAVDSSGFGGPTKQPFRRRKSGGKGKERGWKRAHIMCGVRTGIITAAIVTDAHAHDSQQLPDLLDMACQVFKVKEVLGDAAYSSAVNFEAVLSKKAMPYFMFKKTATGATAGVWRDMYLHFKNHRLDWEEHYRKRKIVESVFSAVKRMFGERLRSKGDVAARNELLLKLLCYNLCCLLRCMDELGIDVEFAREAPNGWLAEP